MAKQNVAHCAFNQGEVSRVALARVDVAKLRLAAEVQVNWLPFVLGTMMLRPGLEFIGQVKDDLPSKSLPFVFSKFDTARLELTDEVMRVWVDDELVTRVSVSTAVADPNFAGGGSWISSDTTAGASVSVTGGVATLVASAVGALSRIRQSLSVALADRSKEHGLRVVVTNGPVRLRMGSAQGLADVIPQTEIDTGTHSLAFTPTGLATVFLQIETTNPGPMTLTSVSIEAAGVLELPTPWTEDDLENIRIDQSGDIVFVACDGLQQRKIERRSTNGWSVVLYRTPDGPFQPAPAIEANFTPSGYVGAITLASDRNYFRSEHVGALFRLFASGQANQRSLVGDNAFSQAVRVTGVGALARNYGWVVTGTWVGTLTLQRSFTSADAGFNDVSTTTSNGTVSSSTGSSAGTPPLDNITCWERIGFKAGDYTSGAAAVTSGYPGGGGYGVVEVTGYTSPTSVSARVLGALVSINGTKSWVEGDWSDARGWPTSVALHEGRLGWFARDQAWLSASDDFTSYAEIDADGNARGDSGPVIQTFGSGPVDAVSWGVSVTRLLLGCEGAIKSLRSSSFDVPLTPTDVSIKDCATQGADRLPALKVDTEVLYVQQSGRRVYELAFSPQKMDYTARDLTRLNIDIGRPGFVAAAAQRQPDTQLHFVRSDGQVAVLLHEPVDEVEGWWRIQTLGVIEDVCVLPANAIEDRVYFTVQRTVDGVVRRFTERLALRDDCAGGAITRLLDSHVVYDGAAATSITLAHLPDTEVHVWADGAYIGTGTTNGSGVLSPLPDGESHEQIVAGLAGQVATRTSSTPVATVTGLDAYEDYPAVVFAEQNGRMQHLGTVTVDGGVITLPDGRTSTSIVACLGYVAPFQSAKLAYAAMGGTALTQKKKLDHLGIVGYDLHPSGVQLGQRMDALDPLPAVEDGADVDPDQVWYDYDQPMTELPGEWDTDARLCLLGQAPYPAKIGALAIAITTSG